MDNNSLQRGWIPVVAAHAGAGASTVALAISDAAAEDGRATHLIEHAPPHRSGLVAAAATELGTVDDGAWRRGLRRNVTIDRRASASAPGALLTMPAGERPEVTVVDLGLVEDDGALPTDDTVTVVVCRTSVPGVRAIEQLLDRLTHRPVIVAAVGPGRWPGEVTSSLGLGLRALQDAGLVVAVPLSRRLTISGLNSDALPKPVLAAGHRLLQLLELTRDESGRKAATTSSAASREGTRR